MSYNRSKRYRAVLPDLDERENAAGGSSLAATEDNTKAPTTDEVKAPTTDEVDTDTTDEGTSLKTVMDTALDNLNKYDPFAFSRQQEIDDLYDKYTKRDAFSYDINADELYNMYKDIYTKQARLASEDAMGRAAALSGGYGNSYAQSVGAQAFHKSMDNLNDIVPDLYEMAYARYKQEGQDMLYKLSALDKQKAEEKEVWRQGYDKLQNEYDLAADNYKGYLDDEEQRKAAEEQRKAAEADWYAANTWNDTGVIDPETGDITYVNGKGKRETFGRNVNPHTNSVNPDLKYNDNEKYTNDLITRSYQPTSVLDTDGKRSKLTFPEGGLEYDVQGNRKYEPIFVSDSGNYYVWDDRNNEYVTIPREKYEKLWREQHPGSPLPDKKGSQGTQPRNYVPYKISEGVNGSY